MLLRISEFISAKSWSFALCRFPLNIKQIIVFFIKNVLNMNRVRLYAVCNVKIYSVATLFLALIQHRYPLTKPTLNPRVIKIHLFCSVNNSLGTVYFSPEWICTDFYNCKIRIFLLSVLDLLCTS
jgi:hypothetical protein